ncbi:hypothetical protein WR25_21597 [Diploscapter pachys]|uniref:Mce/MlaD domain-containing protein n=1 Tax=Diploscapter pachys TaxID=2018661 RepID=A0A2A2KFN9_9BILA|nr:hypothetical protein WR25_21597 [Diploscapter pachys]
MWANLDTLIGGQYLEVLPALKDKGPQRDFIALSDAPEVKGEEVGLPLTLSAARRGSIKPGVPVTYREIAVGKVTGFELGQTADRGATVRTESLETLIDGGIAFATPDGEQMGNPARPQQTFALFDKPEDEWMQWAPKIQIGK